MVQDVNWFHTTFILPEMWHKRERLNSAHHCAQNEVQVGEIFKEGESGWKGEWVASRQQYQ